MPKPRKPSAAKVLVTQTEELEVKVAHLEKELRFYKGQERWTLYGVVMVRGRRQACTKEGLLSYEEARVEAVKAALLGRVEAAIVRLPFGGGSHHREDSRQVVERINGGKGWWE